MKRAATQLTYKKDSAIKQQQKNRKTNRVSRSRSATFQIVLYVRGLSFANYRCLEYSVDIESLMKNPSVPGPEYLDDGCMKVTNASK
jgi:hypothetical protein